MNNMTNVDVEIGNLTLNTRPEMSAEIYKNAMYNYFQICDR